MRLRVDDRRVTLLLGVLAPGVEAVSVSTDSCACGHTCMREYATCVLFICNLLFISACLSLSLSLSLKHTHTNVNYFSSLSAMIFHGQWPPVGNSILWAMLSYGQRLSRGNGLKWTGILWAMVSYGWIKLPWAIVTNGQWTTMGKGF